MTGTEINSKKSEFQLHLGGGIVTALAGVDIQTRLGLENSIPF